MRESTIEKETDALIMALRKHEEDHSALRKAKKELTAIPTKNDEIRKRLKSMGKCDGEEANHRLRELVKALEFSDGEFKGRKDGLMYVSCQLRELHSLSGGIRSANQDDDGEGRFPWEEMICFQSAIKHAEKRSEDAKNSEDSSNQTIVKDITSSAIIPLQRDIGAMVKKLETVIANYKNIIIRSRMIQSATRRISECEKLLEDFSKLTSRNLKELANLKNRITQYLLDRHNDDSGVKNYDSQQTKDCVVCVPGDSLGKVIRELNYDDECDVFHLVSSAIEMYLEEDKENISKSVPATEKLELSPEKNPYKNKLDERLGKDKVELEKFIRSQKEAITKCKKKLSLKVKFSSNPADYTSIRKLFSKFCSHEVVSRKMSVILETVQALDLQNPEDRRLLLDEVAQVGDLVKYLSEDERTRYGLQPFLKCRTKVYHQIDNFGSSRVFMGIMQNESTLLEGVRDELVNLLDKMQQNDGKNLNGGQLINTKVWELSQRLDGIPILRTRISDFCDNMQSIIAMVDDIKCEDGQEATDQICRHLQTDKKFKAKIVMRVKEVGQIYRCIVDRNYIVSELSGEEAQVLQDLFESDPVLIAIREHRGWYAHLIANIGKDEDNDSLARLLESIKTYDLASIKKYCPGASLTLSGVRFFSSQDSQAPPPAEKPLTEIPECERLSRTNQALGAR